MNLTTSILGMMTLCCAACTASPSEPAICVGTLADRKGHAAALIEDGGPLSRGTGAVLLTKLRAGCAE